MQHCIRKGKSHAILPLAFALIDFAQQVFTTRRDILTCVHEPFGDAFYFGPERMSTRYENDEKAREESGFANSTFKTIFERIEREGTEVRLSSILVTFPLPSAMKALVSFHFFKASASKYTGSFSPEPVSIPLALLECINYPPTPAPLHTSNQPQSIFEETHSFP